MSSPDVPAGRLRSPRRLSPGAARASHIRAIAGHREGDRGTPHGCQLCRDPNTIPEPLAVFSPEVDHTNGQRITIVFCEFCLTTALDCLRTLRAAGPGAQQVACLTADKPPRRRRRKRNAP